MQNFSLENHHMVNARRPFRPWDVCGRVGYGWFRWGHIFFPQTPGAMFFAPAYNGRKFFSASYIMSDIFFSAGYCFSQYFSLHAFLPLEISLQDIFFLKSPITPSKVKYLAPKIHQTFAQLTDSDFSIISKAFWNKRGKGSLGERRGIVFYFHYP